VVVNKSFAYSSSCSEFVFVFTVVKFAIDVQREFKSFFAANAINCEVALCLRREQEDRVVLDAENVRAPPS